MREDSNIEDVEDIQEINEIDKVEKNSEVEKGPELIEDNSDSVPYPTPELTIESSYLIWLNLEMPVRSKGVKLAANLAVLPDRLPDLPEIPEYEPAIINQIRNQNEDQF